MSTRAILVVDDDRLIRESLADILDDLGATTAQAEDGLQALEMVISSPPDMVISDIDMPDISGFELLARMHRQTITIPLLLMSARADDNLRHQAELAGAIGLLDKPVGVRPLASMLHSALNWPSF